MKKIKMYKPGQLLTINHKVYRIKRTTSILETCKFCDIRNDGSILCKNVPVDCYLQLVKPKSSLG